MRKTEIGHKGELKVNSHGGVKKMVMMMMMLMMMRQRKSLAFWLFLYFLILVSVYYMTYSSYCAGHGSRKHSCTKRKRDTGHK